jgi:PAS domain S-box-containing protein
MKWTLQNKANVAILITFFLIAIIYIVIQLPFQHRVMESALKRNEVLLHSMVERDREPLANEIFEDRTRAIMIRLAQMRQVDGILNISVFDNTGRLMVSEGARPAHPDLFPEDIPVPPAKILIRKDRVEDKSALVYVQAIEVIRERIGFIRIHYSLADIEQQQHMSYLIFGGLLGSIFIIMLVLLNYILSRVVISPITSLRDAMQRMNSGALGGQVEVAGKDEIGDLTRTFNQMSADLALSYKQIANQNLELHERQQEMAHMRMYLKNIIDSMPSMLISVNEAGIIVEWNEAASRITGIPSIEAIGKEVWALLPHMEKYRGYFKEVIETKTSKEFHSEIIHTGETEEYHTISIFPLIANGIKGIVIRVDDVTEMEKKEQQLRQAQKMEIIGTLAGGLAHDFNNILGGITGSLSLLKFKLQQDKELDRDFMIKYLNIMEEAGRRAADLVKQLLSISSKQEMTLEPVDLDITVEHVMQICRNSFDKRIDLEPLLSGTKAMIKASPTQIEQVLLNLCVNAAHAMTTMRKENEPQGGKLTVSLKNIFADKIFCIAHPEAHEIEYWALTVQDTGVGMDTRTIAKIFDPFFTTKQKDKGTGLGLAMVYNIVQQHGGFIDVYSVVGLGSTFNIYLPVLQGAESAASTEKPFVIPKGEGLILVVDDEEFLRQTAKAILEECGFDVILAENGEEGVMVFEERHGEIKAVLLDMLMPKKSGKEAYLEMKKIDPGLKVLLASGFRQDERVESVLNLGVQGFVQKPYSLESLSKSIFAVINPRF